MVFTVDYIDKYLNGVSYEHYMGNDTRKSLMAIMTGRLVRIAYSLEPELRAEFSPQVWCWLDSLKRGLVYIYYAYEENAHQDHDAIWTFMRRDMAPLKQKVDQIIERRYPS